MSAKLRVYPDKFDNKLFEEIDLSLGHSFEDYLLESIPDYHAGIMNNNNEATKLFSAKINGIDFPEVDWASYILKENDLVEVVVEAKEPMTIAFIVVAVVAAGAAVYAMNQIPDNYNETTPDGSSIYKVNAQGNRPKLMGVIPEVLGNHKVYPDLLNQPHYEYISNDQYLSLFMSVGVGSYEINESEIYIGDTPINRYSGDYDLDIFEPGENVTSHDAHRNIYTSKEVSDVELEGAVATNTSGSERYWTFQNKTLTSKIRRSNPKFEPYPEISRFPYSVGDILSIDSVGEPNDGLFKVVSKDEFTGTMQKVDAQGDDDATWVEFTSQNEVVADIEPLDGSGDHAGPYFVCPEKEKTNKFYIDFELPQGLGELDDDGNFLSRTVNVEIQYRDENTLEWTTVTHSFTNSTNDQLAETLAIDLSESIRPEVRIKRTSASVDDTRIYDLVKWTRLKSELETVDSYDDITIIALKIKGTNNLSRNAENKLNLLVTRKLPTWDPELQSWTSNQITNDISPAFAHIVKDVGHSDSELDLDSLSLLDQTWQNRNDKFNGVFDSPSTLFDVLKRVLAVGYAEPTLDYGQIIPVRDEPREVYEQMYQPQNMMGKGLSQDIKLIDEDEPDGIEVEYFSDQTWKSETVMCLLDGDEAIKPERVRAFGITNRDKAWQFGMRKRRAKRFRRTVYNFKTEMDALNSSYLSYCALADDIPGFSQTGKVLEVIGQTIKVDQVLDWSDGPHLLAIRKPDGEMSGTYTVTKTSDDFEIRLDRPLDFTPIFDGATELPLFMFGTVERWCYPVLITDINPSGTDSATVKAIAYDERVYLDDDNPAPI